MCNHPYDEEVKIVQGAIAFLKSESDASLIKELEQEQLSAGTGLEWYGITKGVFERFLASRTFSDQTRQALKDAIHAVQVIYGSARPN